MVAYGFDLSRISIQFQGNFGAGLVKFLAFILSVLFESVLASVWIDFESILIWFANDFSSLKVQTC